MTAARSHLLHHFVDRAAERDPARHAFRVPGRAVSYGELAERSNQLANLLAADGVRPGDRVGIFMPRCLESALAVYGILKAGAAFVPIDPQAPVGGLANLVEVCGVRHLVADPSLAARVRQLAERAGPIEAVLGAGEDIGGLRCRTWAEVESQPSTAPDVGTTSQDLAYIMFSSGSTGRPKGIMHSHRSGMSYAQLSVATYDVRPEDRVANHSPLHFDMSTFGYFSAPAAGATTVLVPEAYTKMAASLSQLMADERVTIWYSVPLALIQLLTRGTLESRDLGSLRWVLYGGEPFARQYVEALLRHWPQARFSNVYGPAEVNQCTYYHVTDEASPPDDVNAPIPIGRPWGDTEALVLAEDDRPVESGEAGELLIRSSTMMLGYWGRPDLDARAFYEQPVDATYRRRFYRTGDLVREDEKGNLLFLGRMDRQVKVRGYRIELDEVERLLAGDPSVEEAAVFPVIVGGETDHLAAALTAKPGATIDVEALRDTVADLLSWYAVPKSLEVVADLPRTTSGKIDRRYLQATVVARQEKVAVP